MNELSLSNRSRGRPVNLRFARTLTRALLEELLGFARYELGVHFVTRADIVALHGTYLQDFSPTDVITFDYSDRANGNALHGEIFISVDEAVAQARRFGASWQSELARYLVHGVLHLRGFDDLDAARRRVMKREENRLLRALAGRFALSQLRRAAKLSR